MSTIYTDSILKENQQYVIQDVSKLGKETQRLVGCKMTFAYVIGSTAHGRVTGNMNSVPVRSLIHVKGYVAKPKHAVNADGFIVVAQNKLGIPVGQAYLNPTAVTETHAKFSVDGKQISIPLDILASIVRIKEKKDRIIKQQEKKISKESGISVEVTEQLDNKSAREDIKDPIPAFILRMFPELNVADVMDRLKQSKGVFADYEGNIYETIEEADRANVVLRHKILTGYVKEIVAVGTEQRMLKLLGN